MRPTRGRSAGPGAAGATAVRHGPSRRRRVAAIAHLFLLPALLAAGCTLEPKEGMEGRSGDPLADVTGGVVPAVEPGNAPTDETGSTEDRRDALGVAEAVLRAINSADTVLMRRIVDPGAVITQVLEAPDGGARQVSHITVDDFVPGIGDPDQGFLERMWSPRVLVQGAVATVWAPYDFYIAGALSHCGIDTFQLVRRADGWQVAGIVYTRAQPPACQLHPDGPPPG